MKTIKEGFRKFLVSLKRRPHNIPLVMLLITYVVYSINLSAISHTTALINMSPMGLCSFVSMLFPLLGMVSFLNAFPVRQKPKLPMVIILYVIEVLSLVVDIIYFSKMMAGIGKYPEFLQNPDNYFLSTAYNVLVVHMILVGVCIALIALIPVYGKLLNKIDTSIKVEEGAEIGNIEINND